MARARALLLVFVALTVTLAATAQRTWTVDWQNGPGTDFTDLQPALTAASDGDTILVRGPGGPAPFTAYNPGTSVSKALTILGIARPSLFANGFPNGLQISAVPPGRAFVLKGFDFVPVFGVAAALAVEGCGGRVHLESLGLGNQFPCPLTVTNSAAVTVNQCAFGQLPAMSVLNSDRSGLTCTQSVVALTSTSLGGAAAYGWVVHGICMERPGRPGLSATDSSVSFAQGLLRGGDSFPCLTRIPGGPGVQQTRGSLTLAGDATQVWAGQGSPNPAITADGGVLELSPDVQLLPSGGWAPIVGTSSLRLLPLPALRGVGAPAGGLVQLDVLARAGDAALMLAGLPDVPLAVPPYGLLWLSPSTLFVLGGTVVGPGRHWALTLPVPAGTPAGMVFGFQVAAGDLGGVWLGGGLALTLH